MRSFKGIAKYRASQHLPLPSNPLLSHPLPLNSLPSNLLLSHPLPSNPFRTSGRGGIEVGGRRGIASSGVVFAKKYSKTAKAPSPSLLSLQRPSPSPINTSTHNNNLFDNNLATKSNHNYNDNNHDINNNNNDNNIQNNNDEENEKIKIEERREREGRERYVREELKEGLYVVSTPIGNRMDLSPRARLVLLSCRYIFCENKQQIKFLFSQLKLPTDDVIFIPYTNHSHSSSKKSIFSKPYLDAFLANERARKGNEGDEGDLFLRFLQSVDHLSPKDLKIKEMIEKIRRAPCALVAEAGTPSICDPGHQLVNLCHLFRIKGIYGVPGASAVVGGLAVSGFSGDRFIFEGFLPRSPSARLSTLLQLRKQDRTIVFYESPHRIRECLRDCVSVFGPNHEATLVRELTKLFESVKRGSLQELYEYVQEKNKGEFVIVLSAPSPNHSASENENDMDEDDHQCDDLPDHDNPSHGDDKPVDNQS